MKKTDESLFRSQIERIADAVICLRVVAAASCAPRTVFSGSSAPYDWSICYLIRAAGSEVSISHLNIESTQVIGADTSAAGTFVLSLVCAAARVRLTDSQYPRYWLCTGPANNRSRRGRTTWDCRGLHSSIAF